MEYARGWILPNARWSGITKEWEGKMRWGGDVIETEDMHRGYARWRQNRRNRNEDMPTKKGIPRRQRVIWARWRDMRVTQRENPRPILTEEWDCLSEDITWGGTRNPHRKWCGCGCLERNSRGITNAEVEERECRHYEDSMKDRPVWELGGWPRTIRRCAK